MAEDAGLVCGDADTCGGESCDSCVFPFVVVAGEE